MELSGLQRAAPPGSPDGEAPGSPRSPKKPAPEEEAPYSPGAEMRRKKREAEEESRKFRRESTRSSVLNTRLETALTRQRTYTSDHALGQPLFQLTELLPPHVVRHWRYCNIPVSLTASAVIAELGAETAIKTLYYI